MPARRVLAVGSASSKLAAGVPALRRQGFEVDRVSSSETALALARNVRFDLALVDYPLSGMPVTDLAQALAEASARDHRTHVVLVAEPEKMEQARAYVGKGVFTVLSADLAPEESAQVLHEILGSPVRVGLRAPVRVEVSLEEGPSFVFRQTENLSVTGMLVRTPSALPIGTEISFRLDLPGARNSIEGRAQVVRHILAADAQTVVATGMRFASFKGDGDARLRSFVESSVPARP